VGLPSGNGRTYRRDAEDAEVRRENLILHSTDKASGKNGAPAEKTAGATKKPLKIRQI